jgi:hypothetical protein
MRSRVPVTMSGGGPSTRINSPTPPQTAQHLGHRQHHLHRRVSIRRHCLERFDSSLRFNLVRFLHSYSPFLGKRELLFAYQGFELGESLHSTIYRAFSVPFPA